MNKRRPLTVILVVLASVVFPGVVFEASAATATVQMSNFSFSPSTTTIQVGDTVTWVNQDAMEHTSTSGVNGVPNGIWNSDFLGFEQSFSHTFNEPGSFPYFCIPHDFMTGRVIVQGPAITPPTVTITSPVNNSSYGSVTNITIEATATAPGATVANIEFFNGTSSLAVDTSVPYTANAELAVGTHTLTARVTTSTGATATSEPITVTVTAVTPPVGTRIENAFEARIAKGDLTIELETVLDGLISPLGLAAPDDSSGRLFVYDQAGLVHVLSNGEALDTPLLDVRDRLVPLDNYDERGLLGLAVHPGFAQNPLIYTYTSEPVSGTAHFTAVLPEGATHNHQSVITEWRLDPANTNRVDLSSRREILRIDQPQANHNGGTMHFGPDGHLYISLGDAGSADDQGNGHVPGGNGQDIENIYGKIIRIDVNGRAASNGQYSVPADNPFVGQPGLDEIFAYGFRNPYTFSFDRMTGELYVADVGQNHVEELNRVFRGGNYGWPIKEAGFYFDPNGTEAGFITTLPVRDVPADLVDPIAQYDHDDGVAIVSGYVYRGTQIPGLLGRYVGGDWGSFSSPTGRLFYLDRSEFKEIRIGVEDRPLGLWLKGYGQDASGELYIFGSTNLGPGGTSGKVLRIVPPGPLQLAAGRTGTNLTVSWTNGVGPFAIRSSADVASDAWELIGFSQAGSMDFPMDESASFVRVAPVSGNFATPFTAWLSGAAERPNPVQTSAIGSGTLSLEGNTLHFNVSYSGLSGAAVAAHIHGPASASGAAGVVLDLAPFNGGAFGTNGTLSGSATITPELKAMLLTGTTYINIHTPANGGGEIRGQIAPVAFTSALSGDAERPQPVATSATGRGNFMLAGNQLSFNVTYRDLSGAAVAAHIHGPASPDEAAGVMIDLMPHAVGGLGAQGTIAGTVTLDAQQLANVVDGRTYVNIHTPQNGGGEIRGQILPNSTGVPMSASLSGAAERPNPVTTDATGVGYFILEGSRLRFQVGYTGLSGAAVAAHIHGPARASAAAGVMIDLAPFALGGFGTAGTLAGTVPLTPLQRAQILQGLTYVNIHTPNNPGGEIRGQISTVLFHSVLLGASERPAAVHTPAVGFGHFLLVGNQLSVNATYRGLSSAATAAHIHGPADTSGSAGVMINLGDLNGGVFGTSGSFSGTKTATPEQVTAILDLMTYMNIHTAPHPAGEIRGQLIR